jgi:hypothetical protein
MKQYVLDQPTALAPPAPAPGAESLPPPRRWRWLLLILLLEPVALAGLYLILNSGSAESAPVAGPVVAHVAAQPAAAPAALQAATPAEDRAPPIADPEPAGPAQATSRISHERGRYVVDLHATPLGAALEMLSTATKARVTGGDIFAGSALQLTRSAVAATPQEAWQAVFSEVASFAITCAAGGCDVRFVSLTAPEGNGSTASRPGVSGAQGAGYPSAMARPAAAPAVAAPAWGAAAAPGPEPTSSDN